QAALSATGWLLLILDFAIKDMDQAFGIIRIRLDEVRGLEAKRRACRRIAGQLVSERFGREWRAVVVDRVYGVGDMVLGVGDEGLGLRLLVFGRQFCVRLAPAIANRGGLQNVAEIVHF